MYLQRKDWIRLAGVFVIACVVGLIATWFIWGNAPVPKILAKTYENKDLAINFSYPESYILTEKNLSTNKDDHAIFLFENRFVYESASSTLSELIERTPDVISIETLNRGLEIDIADWVKNNATSSHFLLSDQTFESAVVANKKIISYVWSNNAGKEGDINGVVEGTTIALIHNGKVFLITVAFNKDSEKIRDNFISLLSTVQFL